MAATVANWLPSNLQHVLHERVNKQVEPNLDKLALSGHSRGGKSAFALALGLSKTKLSLKISALIGVDPVEGRNKNKRTRPYVLTYEPNSFNLSIPVTIIGTGLGNHTKLLNPACAPNGVNHQEFFNECNKECSHFVIMEYGHMQMLNDVLDALAISMSRVCASKRGSNSIMRRTLGGVMVAFLGACFGDEGGQYFAILDNPSLAPTKLYANNKGILGLAPSYAL